MAVKRKLIATLAGLLVGTALVLTCTDAMAQAANVQHPYIYDGFKLLARARYVLNHGKHGFGGHRTAAIREIDAALAELRSAIAADHGTEPAPMAESGTPMLVGGQHHPYMHDALRLCEQAKAALEKGSQDFGGHRVAALQHVDQAIAQLQLAANYPRHE
jgi:hypothetical protein